MITVLKVKYAETAGIKYLLLAPKIADLWIFFWKVSFVQKPYFQPWKWAAGLQNNKFLKISMMVKSS